MRYQEYVHVHVSEREGAHEWPDGQWDDRIWEDCLWTSAIEIVRFVGLTAIPATHYEAEALRDASGEPPLGGSNHSDLSDGLLVRYGISLRQGLGFSALTVLSVGSGAVVNGSWSRFPLSHRLRRWDDFAGGHSIAVFRLDTSARFWICDPLAPGDYDGEWASFSEVSTFMSGFDGRFMYGRYNELRQENMGAILVQMHAYPGTFVIPAGIRPVGLKIDLATGTIIERKPWPVSAAASSARYDANVDLSGINIRGNPYIRGKDGFFAGYYVSSAGLQIGPPEVPADDTPYDLAAVQAAKLEGRTEGIMEGLLTGHREAAIGVRDAAAAKAAEYGA